MYFVLLYTYYVIYYKDTHKKIQYAVIVHIILSKNIDKYIENSTISEIQTILYVNIIINLLVFTYRIRPL